MKKLIFVLLLMSLILTLTACKTKETSTEEPIVEPNDPIENRESTITEIAENFFQDLIDKKFNEAYTNYIHDEAMKSQVNALQYAAIMSSLVQQVGNFESFIGTEVSSTQGYDVVSILAKFEQETISFNVVFDGDKAIAGLNFTPYYEPKVSKYKSIELTFGEEYPLSGTLTLPDNVDTPPIVIFVHGSGPNDRDETVGPNKPFWDLAEGLAANGIATFRYDKRTYVYSDKLSSLTNATVYDETIEDVLLAIELLRTLDTVDANKLYILGHSLGGHLVPRIASETELPAGYIIMAGNARNLLDMLPEQYEYLFNLDGSMNQEEQDTLQAILEQVTMIKEGSIDAETPILGAYKAYWQDLLNYDPMKMVQLIKEPILFLQGERDYQVTLEDFNQWKAAVGTNPNHSFKTFSTLNHLMMSGEGMPNPDEYLIPNEVDSNVIKSISQFIN